MALTIWELLFWGFLQAIVIAWVATKLFKHVKLVGPLILWKSKVGLKWMAHVSKRFKHGWRAYGDLGIILAFGFVGAWFVFRKQPKLKRILLSAVSPLFLLSPFISTFLLEGAVLQGLFEMASMPLVLLYFGGYSVSLVFLLSQEALKIISGYFIGAPVQAAVAPALPGIDIQGSPFRIPWYGWLAFPILIAVHELSHGVLARVEGFRVKATGIVLFGLFPFGAFVEPDEKQLNKGAAHKQLRVYSVGSTANYLTAFLVLSFILFAVNPIMESSNFVDTYNSYYDHPEVLSMLKTSDFVAAFEVGDKVQAINGTVTNSISDLHTITAGMGANAYVSITTNRGTFGGNLDANAKIGIASLRDTFKPMPWELTMTVDVIGFLGLVVFFNFVVGIMNLLPMYPLDGGLMVRSLLGKWFGKKRAKVWAKWITIYVLLLFAVNIFPLFFPNF